LGALNVDFEFVFRDLVTEPKHNLCPTQILCLFLVVAAASWVICSRVVLNTLASSAALPPNLVALSGILLASVRSGLAFFGEAGFHLTGAEWCPAQKLETGWLLAQALRSQPESVWQLVRARQRRRPPNQLERTR